MGFTYNGVSHSSTGYNGFTGAAAQWNEAKGMWVDANGVEIRDDAITATPPPQAPPSAAPSPSVPGAPAPPAGGSGPMQGLKGGANSGGGDAGGAGALYNLGAPSQANPLLGQRNLPMQTLRLALQPKIY